MTQPFLGEIRAFGFTFPPVGWALCNGQLIPIATNTALFSLLGTTYGGNGTSTFALPDLQGRVALHEGQGPGLSPYVLGEEGGEDAVTLLDGELPSHTHTAMAVGAKGTSASPTGATWAEAWVGRGVVPAFSNVTTTPQSLNPGAVGPAGGSSPHENRPPLLALTFCIALQGIFPARN